MKILQDLWAHHNERKREKLLSKAAPIVAAFLVEYGEPKRPPEGMPANNFDKVLKCSKT